VSKRGGRNSVTEGPQGARAGVDPIRVLIADDHALFRCALEMVLKEEPGIELVGQASDGAEAVQIAGEALPDVVLMDIRMPKLTGIEAARQLNEVVPSAKIVMLTISDEEEDRFGAVRAGRAATCSRTYRWTRWPRPSVSSSSNPAGAH
jgi:two-component system NarL family response regulator